MSAIWCACYAPFSVVYVCTWYMCVIICLYCVICVMLYYRSLLICTNKEFMTTFVSNQHITANFIIIENELRSPLSTVTCT